MMSKELIKILPVLVIMLVFLSINIVQSQVLEIDTIEINQSFENNGDEQQTPSFKTIISPNLSLNLPVSGDDVDKYKIGLKYGANIMFKIDMSILFEFGFSIAPLNIQSNYISSYIRGPYGEEVSNIDIKESKTKETQILLGIRYLLPSKGNNITYLKFGASNNKRNNTKVSYSGNGSYFTTEGELEIYDEESSIGIFGGAGIMIFVGKKITLDLQINSIFLFREDSKPIWFDPTVGLNILL